MCCKVCNFAENCNISVTTVKKTVAIVATQVSQVQLFCLNLASPLVYGPMALSLFPYVICSCISG